MKSILKVFIFSTLLFSSLGFSCGNAEHSASHQPTAKKNSHPPCDCLHKEPKQKKKSTAPIKSQVRDSSRI